MNFVETPSQLIAEVQENFVLRDQRAVIAFLKENREIPQLLMHALPHLKRTFGTGTVFSLRTILDESGAEELYAAAMWPGKAPDAAAALENFETEWWIANSLPAAGSLNFTYELQ